jgi:hypothetical protein
MDVAARADGSLGGRRRGVEVLVNIGFELRC